MGSIRGQMDECFKCRRIFFWSLLKYEKVTRVGNGRMTVAVSD